MELLFELLLTAAATLLVACLLAKLFAAANADQPRHDRAVVGPADVIAVEEEEEERIIEVDQVEVQRAPAPALSEGWVEVEKAPAADVAAEGKKTQWVTQEVPATLAPELFLGTVLEERKEEGEVGKMPRDLTPAAAAAATEVAAKDLGVEAAPREILGLELEGDRTQQDDSGAQVVPTEVLDAELQKQQVQPSEAVEVKQRHLVAEAAPAQVIDAGLAGVQAAEAIPQELVSETVPGEVPDVVLEKQQEEQVIEVDQHELAAEVAPREITDQVARELASEVAPSEIPDQVARESASEVAPRAIPHVVATEEELKEQSVEEVAGQDEEVQNKEEAQREASPVDQPEKLVPKEELLVTKADDLNVSPEKEAALPGMLEGQARANMEFEEWEGIERSEVEKRFGVAAAFAASHTGAAALSKLDSDVQLQLQGLLKVAVDGPCYDSAQPLTLRPSSRAKWVSWQKLGNMHPEIAMGKYMDLLSEFIPGWMGDKASSTKKHEGGADPEGAALTMTSSRSDPRTFQGNEDSTSIEEGPLTSPPNPDKGQSCDIPAE